MGKRVVIKLDGTLEQGFHVTLEIGEEGKLHFKEETGHLPPNSDIINCLTEWQQNYRQLSRNTRITLNNITVEPVLVNQCQTCRELGIKLEILFKKWLESESFFHIDKALRQELDKSEFIRVLIRTKDSQVHHLPWHSWEFIERFYLKAEIAFNVIPGPAIKTSTPGEKVRILAILGDSTGIDTETDRQLLKSLPNADVLFLAASTRQEINDQLWEQPWDILFFAGHSRTEEKKGRIYINGNDSLTVDELRHALRQAVTGGLQLAIFNSCDGLGLAYELEQLHLPQLIVMREPVPDEVAQAFLKYFLTAFARGDSLYLAERRARERLQGLEEKFPCASWLPVIFQNPTALPPKWEDLWEKPIPETVSTPVRKRPKLIFVVIASLVIAFLIIAARYQGHLQTMELAAYDQLTRLRPIIEQPKPDDRLLVVTIDRKDIESLKQKPDEIGQGGRTLSDRILDELFKKLEGYKPEVIGLDLFRAGTVNPKDYPNFASGLESGGVVAVCFEPGDTDDTIGKAPTNVLDENVGFADLIRDKPDRVIRRHYLFAGGFEDREICRNKKLGSFSLKVAINYLESKSKGKIKHQIGHDFIKIGDVVFNSLKRRVASYNNIEISTPSGGIQTILNYRSYKNYRTDIAKTITLTDVLGNNKLFKDDVEGKIVLIGNDMQGKDRHRTPYTISNETSDELPGILLHAQAVSHILDTVEGKRSPINAWDWWIDAVWIWAWSLVGGALVWFVGWQKGLNRISLLRIVVLASFAFVSLYGLCFNFLLCWGTWVPLVPSALVLCITSASVIIYMLLQTKLHQ
jgi:CHASE2 domain-containing sensor protein